MADSKQKRIEELLKQIRSVPREADDNDVVHQAIEELRSEGWLMDGSLREADLRKVNLRGADLLGANLRGANLMGANLREANLMGANLRGANLMEANLMGANLTEADLTKVYTGRTTFTDVDLSSVKGLETIRHTEASTLSHETLFNYERLPDVFLKGCGLPEIFITYYSALREEAIMFYDVFISYSHADKTFARRLHSELQSRGVRCWLDEHDMKIGTPIHRGITEGIKLSDRLILCCSENSLQSDWVNGELTRAFEKERRLRREQDVRTDLLLPIDLDGFIFKEDEVAKTVTEGKAPLIRERLMLNMQNWDDLSTGAFNAQVEKLVDALRRDPAADA